MFEIFKLSKIKRRLEEDIALLTADKEMMLSEIDNYDRQRHDAYNKCTDAVNAAYDAQRALAELKGQINTIEEIHDYNIPYYQDSLDDLEHQRYELQSMIESAVRTGLYRIEYGYTLNGNARKGKEMQNVYGKGLCYAMTQYIDSKEKTITAANAAKNKELIRSKFNSYQEKAHKVGLALNAEYVKARLEILDINLAIKVKKKEEAARIKEEKRRIREQEQLLADIARERVNLVEERKAMNLAFCKALTDEERAKIKATMAAIDKRLESIKYRETHTQSGWFYVISSPSLPGLLKLGCTRRINPTIRVKELSSSSIPDPYKAHCFVFSDDCFELESQMHKYFDKERINPDREFFRIEPSAAINALKNVFHVDVHFVNENWEDEIID